jgi:serine protease Do/serine protease DegQ
LIDYVSVKGPGVTVEVGLIRNGKKLNKKVKLEERPEADETAAAEEESEEESELEWLGIQYTDLSGDLRERMGLESRVRGVVVTRVAPSSPLYDEGIQPFDIITQVNGLDVEDAQAFEKIVSQASSGDFLRLYVGSVRGGEVLSRFAVVEVP